MTSISFHSGNVHETPHEPARPDGEHRGAGTTPDQTGSPHGGIASSSTTNRESAGSTPPGRTGLLRGTRPVGDDIRATADNQRAGTRGMDGGLPDRYIAHPTGDMQSDPSNPGIFFDNRGQRYLQSGANWYGAAHDKDSGTWRAVSHDEPGKPGIPVEQRSNGTWRVHADAGLKGGGGSELDKARARTDVQTKKTELAAKLAEGSAKKAELDNARSTKTNAEARISDLDRGKYEVMRRLDDASAQTSHYEHKAEQARRLYEDAKRRYDAAPRPMSADQRAGLPPDVQAAFAQNSYALHSVSSDESVVRDAQREQREYEDKRWEWSGKRDGAERELQKIQDELSEAWRGKMRSDDNISRLENELASLESDRLNHERQLTDLERELSRLEAP